MAVQNRTISIFIQNVQDYCRSKSDYNETEIQRCLQVISNFCVGYLTLFLCSIMIKTGILYYHFQLDTMPCLLFAV